jgi:hypothetical protein
MSAPAIGNRRVVVVVVVEEVPRPGRPTHDARRHRR